ncbi:MAG: (2Fe-2S)-binding protein [Pelagibacteraceae bacterium]|nr:(2Fe-2S)-binding protein [Pelagibacteraceae bacterium]PPR09950.1 MAG: Carbon monoxide dehydrogenase small chain [Alphaproteobacteria bacterium MarineAlpha11_Bin1]|tara:strand:- start:2631 stop:3116 length:486 start_codon:yes stop_codon:yes gene_type:complete
MLRIKANQKQRVTVTINGKELSGFAEPRLLLTDFLRHELGMYGTHVGCEHGVCGACTIIIDNVATRSCLRYAVQCDGMELITVEGLADPDGMLNSLQKAFNENGALQCGFCTAGILMSATKFLQENSNPTRDEVRDMLSGHICRCTGYEQIVRAILQASEK